MLGARRTFMVDPWTGRATPQTPLSQPTFRTLADFASGIVVTSLLRGLLTQAPRPGGHDGADVFALNNAHQIAGVEQVENLQR